jgi:hypothetical protein
MGWTIWLLARLVLAVGLMSIGSLVFLSEGSTLIRGSRLLGAREGALVVLAGPLAGNSNDNAGGAQPTATRAPTSTAPQNADNFDNFDNSESLFDDDDDDDDDDDSTEDFDPGLGLAPLSDVVARASACAPAGQQTVVSLPDGRASVQVPASMPQSVRVTLSELSITSPSVPPTSGLRVGSLIVRLEAERCEGGSLAPLPAEVSLVMRYSELDVSSLDETRLVLALLDSASQQWQPVPNQLADPLGNSVSAGVTTAGVYTVYQTLGWARPQPAPNRQLEDRPAAPQ